MAEIFEKPPTFAEALAIEKPLQIVGVTNAYTALMAKNSGFQALYLSGAGVANSCFGLSDLGLTTFNDVAEEVRRIRARVALPILVDVDTGWGGALVIKRAVHMIEQAGASAIHIEDQELFKRCGHRQNKAIVTKEKMVYRIKAAVDSRKDSHFLIMARSDAFASEGLERTLERALAYKEAGADLFFPEALQNLADYTLLRDALQIPILANLTEFGKTPLFTLPELLKARVDMALYPLSIFRAMNFAALEALKIIRRSGTQKELLTKMQSREELYTFLEYQKQEEIVTSEREDL